MAEQIHAEMGAPEGGKKPPEPSIALYEKGSREEEAERSLKQTAVTRAMAWTLGLLFLATIFLEPVLQHVVEIRAGLVSSNRSDPSDKSDGVRSPARARVLPQAYDVFSLLPSASAIGGVRSLQDVWTLLPKVDAIKAFETGLEENSVSCRFLLPRTQYLLARFGGAGNEKVYIGREGWLFYRPEVDYLTEPGFLSPQQLRNRTRIGREASQPDPRKAILQFHEQLARRGIQLIVIPMPSKAMVDPDRFTRRYDALRNVLQNPSFMQFKSELESAGVLVFDLGPALADRKRATGSPQYLETDTHWRPETMEYAAGLLKEFVAQHVNLPVVASAGYRQVAEPATNLGDIAAMLSLPEGKNLYRRQTVSVHQVLNARNELWQPNAAADVLLLGDSYSNIYSLDAMGWGYDAGFAEQLSFAMQRPVDRIVRNDAGAYATRQMLARELAQGHDRLAGKRLVIWEFADRELAVGDWKLLELKTPQEVALIRSQAQRDESFFVASAGEETLVRGTVESVSAAPRPGSVPYRDHILAIHLVDIEGVNKPVGAKQAIVYMWDMRDNKLTKAAHYRPGDRLTLRLTAWADVASKYEAVNRSELESGDIQLQEPNWGQGESP
jgi:hypothetical protein